MQLSWNVRETWLHGVNPSLKLLGSVMVFFLLMFTDNINILANATWMLLVLLFAGTGHPVRRLLLLLLPFALLFVSSSTSMIFFGKGETTWLRYGLVHVTEESFYRGLHIGLKTVDMALAGMIFALTTRPVRLFYSLMQQLRMPAKYAYSFMAALRLMPMAAEEYRTLQMALKVRGVRYSQGPGGWISRLQHAVIPLLAQSIRRAQRIAVAMEAKRFSAAGGERTFYYTIGWSVRDAGFVALLAGCAAAAFYLGHYAPFFHVGDVRYHVI